MEKFTKLGLTKGLTDVLKQFGFKEPSEIQEKAIPLALAGKDIIGGSATGSGKTLVFASPIIEKLKRNGEVQAMVLTPTRELAEQVATSIRKFSKNKNINVLAVYGGVRIDSQIKNISKTDVLVGTPGRIIDHLTRKTLRLNKIKFLVLDEVDRMFDMGFKFDVEKILKQCPAKRQTMLFSATISPDIDYLANKYTQDAQEVAVKSHVDPSKLKQVLYDVPDSLKFSLLVHLLKKEKAKLVMVFCGTRRNVDFVTKNLTNIGINAKAIHGGLNQNQRNKVMEEFNSDKGITVLICTDVAARGLDIPGVSHIYNYDIPKTSTEYIHRIGRTARAGKEGIAINILCSRDYENFSIVTQDEKLKISKLKLPYLERVNIITKKRSFGRRSREGRDFKSRSISPQRRTGRFQRTRSFRQSRNRDSSRGRNYNSRNPSRDRDNSRHQGRARPNNNKKRS
jgi:ATP-dependent RNA helicase DeaD